jgi:hypothetical protein
MEADKIQYFEFERIDSERIVSGNNFENGEIIYKKFMSTGAKINLSRSYIKLTLSISSDTGANGAPGDVDLLLKDNLSPTFLACETLFKSSYYRINNVIISEIGDHLAQISAINSRLNYSEGYRDSVLKDMNFGKPEFSERQKSMLKLTHNGGEQIEEKSKPGASLSTLSVTIAGQVDGLAGTAQADLAQGSIFEIYDNATGKILLYRGTIQQEDAANQWQSSPRPAVAVAASVHWVRIQKKTNHRGVRKIQCIFRPSLGIFQQDEWILGHDFELSLFPHSKTLYKKFFMQSLISDKVPGTDYDISIDDMIFYPCIGYLEKSLEQAEYDCSFMETRMQIQNITSSSDIDRTFVIDKHTKFVTMSLQDSRASGGNTLFPRTLFKVGKNSAGVDTDLDLKSYVILYDIYQFPRPQHDQERTENVDRMAQAYYENLTYSGQQKYLPDMESLADFEKLGAYYHYKIPIRKGQSNPKLSIKTSFRSSFSADAKPNLLLFDHFRRSFKLIARNGRVVQVIPQSQAE